jgi:hypothetical protein
MPELLLKRVSAHDRLSDKFGIATLLKTLPSEAAQSLAAGGRDLCRTQDQFTFVDRSCLAYESANPS